jgi:YHS domain-containing protein
MIIMLKQSLERQMIHRRSFITLTAALALAAGVMGAERAFAAGPDVNATVTGLALRGFDPVAYFTDMKPVAGDFTITASYNGATYRFASPDHKALFEKNPEKYLPQYGGFCAFGAAQGYKVDGDPHVWKIVDSKLYLNLAPPVAERWLEDVPGHISSADRNWPGIKHKPPEDLLK